MTPSGTFTDRYERGVAHLKRMEYDQAVVAFTQAIRLDPEAPNAYIGRAIAHRSLGDDAAAGQDDRSALGRGGAKPSNESPPTFLMPDDQLRHRVDREQFVDFLLAAMDALESYFRRPLPPDGFDLLVAVALVPGGGWLLDVQHQPAAERGELLAGLSRCLEAIPRPAVRHGPVAFCKASAVQGGSHRHHAGFRTPFASLLPAGQQQGSLDDLLMAGAGCRAERGAWWNRLKRVFDAGK
jgi:tetratricopeptide (TPR) repeat protein